MNKASTLSFTKMHGLGNDILVVDRLETKIALNTTILRALSDRHTGIGFDQLITIEPSNTSADVFCRIFNADGSEAQQCGNGLRCIARYLHDRKLVLSNTLSIETIAGIFPIVIHDNGNISVSMNSPTILDTNLVLAVPNLGEFRMTSLSVGNPHVVTRVDSIADTPIATIGSLLSTHTQFPEGTNVGFMQVNDQHQMTLRTFERGTGLTLACGSNACAAAVAGITQGWLISPVTVNFERGSLVISWNQRDELTMTGPAEYCFSGDVSESLY